MKILVLGSKGQLGRCLYDQLKNTTHDCIFTSREQIDIADFESTRKNILEINPEVLINATAYTAVDKAEEEQEIAQLINHLAVTNIARICNQLSCWLIHISTDYVFDGNSTTPYKEEDKTNPQNIYGETKLKGERAIQSLACKYIIIRTAWVFSEYGTNFLKTLLRLGAEREELRIVRDQIGCPTYAQDIAKSITKVVSHLHAQKGSGLYHYCGDPPCSWYGFAHAIFEQAKATKLKTPSILHSIETSSYPTQAKRPAFSVLDCSNIENEFGVLKSHWHEGIKLVIGTLQHHTL
jgi:dTDP-4-dehydrorhamnose reductase